MFKQKRDPAPDKPRLEPADAVQQARTRARQRLIGAAVLLAIGIIGFPLVFETQPRPIPVDVPIEIPRRDSLPPLAMPPARAPTRPAPSDVAANVPAPPVTPAAPAPAPAARPPAPAMRGGDGVITESSADAGREVNPPARPTPSERVAARPAAPASTACWRRRIFASSETDLRSQRAQRVSSVVRHATPFSSVAAVVTGRGAQKANTVRGIFGRGAWLRPNSAPRVTCQ